MRRSSHERETKIAQHDVRILNQVGPDDLIWITCDAEYLTYQWYAQYWHAGE